MTLRRRLYHVYALCRRRLLRIPPPGQIDFGDFRRVAPISRGYGADRGLPVDRYYIERFLSHHAADIRGRVLEIGSNDYTLRFGSSHVTRSDVLDVRSGPGVTIVADLAEAPGIPDDSFDAIILTQTLQYVFDVRGAVSTLHRILRPAGVLLLTVPGVTLVPSRTGEGRSWMWAFTPVSVDRLLTAAFGRAGLSISVAGNVLVACAFLQGLATADLAEDELEVTDPDYPVIVMARVVKGKPIPLAR